MSCVLYVQLGVATKALLFQSDRVVNNREGSHGVAAQGGSNTVGDWSVNNLQGSPDLPIHIFNVRSLESLEEWTKQPSQFVSAILVTWSPDLEIMSKLFALLNHPRFHFVPKFIHALGHFAEDTKALFSLKSDAFCLEEVIERDGQLQKDSATKVLRRISDYLNDRSPAPLAAIGHLLAKVAQQKIRSLKPELLETSMLDLIHKLRSYIRGFEFYRFIELDDDEMVGLVIKAKLNRSVLKDLLLVVSASEALSRFQAVHQKVNRICGNVLKRPFVETGTFCIKAQVFELGDIDWVGLRSFRDCESLSSDHLERLKASLLKQAHVSIDKLGTEGLAVPLLSKRVADASLLPETAGSLRTQLKQFLEEDQQLALSSLQWVRDRINRNLADVNTRVIAKTETHFFFHGVSGDTTWMDARKVVLLDCFTMIQAPIFYSYLQLEMLLRFEFCPYVNFGAIVQLEQGLASADALDESADQAVRSELKDIIQAIKDLRQKCFERFHLKEAEYSQAIQGLILLRLHSVMNKKARFSFEHENIATRLFLGLLSEQAQFSKTQMSQSPLEDEALDSPRLTLKNEILYFDGQRLDKQLRGNGKLLFLHLFGNRGQLCPRKQLGDLAYPYYDDTNPNDFIKLNTAIHRMRKHLLEQIQKVDPSFSEDEIKDLIQLDHGKGYKLNL